MDKILIISYSFPPDNVPAAQRPYFMAKYLKEEKLLEPIVLTSHSSRSSLGKSNWADLTGLNVISTEAANETAENATASTVAVKAKRTGKFAAIAQKISREILIPDKAVTWYKKARKKAEDIMEQNPGIKYIFSTSPSVVNHQVAMWIKKHYNVKWIADFRDFYYCSNIEENSFIFRHHFDKRIERKIIETADRLTYISGGMMDEYRKKYPIIVSKSAVVHNGFDTNEFNFTIPDLPANKKLTIFYGGSFYKGQRSPKSLLLALENLVEKQVISPGEIEVVIAGNIPTEIFDEFTGYRIFRSVKLLGFIDRKKALEEMLNAHFLWLIIAAEKAHYLGFPVKGYEYIGARRHILVFTPKVSEPARIINELQCGTVLGISDDDRRENMEKLTLLINQFKKGAFAKPISINKNLLKKYTRIHQAHQLWALTQEIKN